MLIQSTIVLIGTFCEMKITDVVSWNWCYCISKKCLKWISVCINNLICWRTSPCCSEPWIDTKPVPRLVVLHWNGPRTVELPGCWKWRWSAVQWKFSQCSSCGIDHIPNFQSIRWAACYQSLVSDSEQKVLQQHVILVCGLPDVSMILSLMRLTHCATESIATSWEANSSIPSTRIPQCYYRPMVCTCLECPGL